MKNIKSIAAGLVTGGAIMGGVLPAGAQAAPFALTQTFDDPTPTGIDFFGNSVSISGNNVLIGARADDTNGANVGQAHLFTISEPGALALFSLGLAGLMLRRRGRSSQA